MTERFKSATSQYIVFAVEELARLAYPSSSPRRVLESETETRRPHTLSGPGRLSRS